MTEDKTGSPDSADAAPRGLSRRGYLTAGATGVAGLLIGGGGVQALHAASGSGADEGPDVPSPGEELMTEHGVLKRILLAYRTVHDRLVAGQQVSTDPLIDGSQIVSDYVESLHEGLEEAYVFPRVAEQNAALVRTLIVQHDRGRHLTRAIQDLVSAGVSTAAQRVELAGYLASFVGMYEPHEAWEDTVIYPALRASTSQKTLDELAERFHDLENAQYGDQALATILGRVEGIEQQLGIDDLNSFTPPPLT